MQLNIKKLTKRTNFYFVRHGETTANFHGIIGGGLNHDPLLTEKGINQAITLGAWMKKEGFKIDYAICSPLKRAVATSKYIIKEIEYKGELFETPDLKEIETGIFTNHTYKEVENKFPKEFSEFKKSLWNAIGESNEELNDRILRVLNSLIDTAEKEDKRNILLVAHWGTLQWVFKNISGNNQSWKPTISFKNCSISNLSVTPCFQEDTNEIKDDEHYIEWMYIAKNAGE